MINFFIKTVVKPAIESKTYSKICYKTPVRLEHLINISRVE